MPNDPVPLQSIRVTAPARLHLGFLDLRGDGERRFGGLGLTLDTVCTRLEATRAPRGRIRVEGPDAELMRGLARRVVRHAGLPGGASIRVLRSIPRHGGLGSGTQATLAVGASLLRLYGRKADPRELATRMGRGRRSGIGVGAFSAGGFLLDGGTAGRGIPPILARLAFPVDWGLLLVLDEARQGLHGQAERGFFARLSEQPVADAARLCRLCLLRLLPALAEADCAAFCAALDTLQRAMSRSFSGAQGGAYTSPGVGVVLAWLRRRAHALGCGQSSWGPTGFALFPSRAAARRARVAAQEHFGASAEMRGLRFLSVGGRNRGATVQVRRRAR